MSQGKTKKEALENVAKAIKAYMETIEKSGKKKGAEAEIINVPVPLVS